MSKVSVLIPGAGLGRLAWEIARLGYICQGNEWSFFMLFSSNFVLNRYSIYTATITPLTPAALHNTTLKDYCLSMQVCLLAEGVTVY